MIGSIKEVWSHDGTIGGRSVTGVQRENNKAQLGHECGNYSGNNKKIIGSSKNKEKFRNNR